MTIEEYKDILISMLGGLWTECKGIRCSDCPLLGQCIQKTQEKMRHSIIYTKPFSYDKYGEIYPCKSDIFDKTYEIVDKVESEE